MTEEKNTLAELFAACWKDEALKTRFMADPKAVLKEHGMPVPDGMDVKVVENADDCVHITLPAPPAGHTDLSDQEMLNAAGGTNSVTVQPCASRQPVTLCANCTKALPHCPD